MPRDEEIIMASTDTVRAPPPPPPKTPPPLLCVGREGCGTRPGRRGPEFFRFFVISFTRLHPKTTDGGEAKRARMSKGGGVRGRRASERAAVDAEQWGWRRGGWGGQTTSAARDVRVVYKACRGERNGAYREMGLAAGPRFRASKLVAPRVGKLIAKLGSPNGRRRCLLSCEL